MLVDVAFQNDLKDTNYSNDSESECQCCEAFYSCGIALTIFSSSAQKPARQAHPAEGFPNAVVGDMGECPFCKVVMWELGRGAKGRETGERLCLSELCMCPRKIPIKKKKEINKIKGFFFKKEIKYKMAKGKE